jgi:hypothetical protein
MPETLLPLEQWLKKRAKGEAFPDSKINYFDRYNSIKTTLMPILEQVNSSLAQEGGIHTDHGPNHVDQVIRWVGKLLQCEDKNSNLVVKPYEVYVLLVAILAHDAGNVTGRQNHEQRAFEILRSKCDSIVPDTIELKAISEIAKAHGGKYFGSKDTIHALKDTDAFDDASFRPRLLAGLVRLADEICENRKRAVSDETPVGQRNIIFHKYAKSIYNTSIDRKSKLIRIEYHLFVSQLPSKFPNSLGKRVFLVDEIFARLEKMYLELAYCSKFVWEVVRLDGVQGKITIMNDENYDAITEQRVELVNIGYPENEKQLFKQHREWTGKVLKKRCDNGEFTSSSKSKKSSKGRGGGRLNG